MFCGHEREDFQHLFIDCVVARDAVAAMAEHKRPLFREAAAYLKNATLGDFQLEKKNMKVVHIRVVLSFSLAIWKTRRFYRVKVGSPALNQAHRRVLLELSPLLYNWLGGGRRNKEAERRSFLAAVSILPTPATFVYTDGSSYGNPGPSGAGFAVSDDNDHFRHLGSRSLGRSTNNAAELEAIKDATSFVLGESNVSPVYIFSDNRLAIQVAMGRAHPEWAAEVTRSIGENITALSATRAVHLLWVPGHADVPGNEVADKLAKLGSSGVSGAWTSLTELPEFSAPQPETAGPGASHSIAAGCEQCARVLQDMLATANPRRKPPRKVRARSSGPSGSRYNLRSKKVAKVQATSARALEHRLPPALATSRDQPAQLGEGRASKRARHHPDCSWGYESDQDWEASEPSDLNEPSAPQAGWPAPSLSRTPMLEAQPAAGGTCTVTSSFPFSLVSQDNLGASAPAVAAVGPALAARPPVLSSSASADCGLRRWCLPCCSG